MIHRRRGTTLIEMLVLITLIGVVLTGTATTLVMLLRIERQVRTDQEQHRTLANLTGQWRADAHAAIAAGATDSCDFILADGRAIRYSFAAPRIVREVRRDGDIVHRDAFVLSNHAQVAFSVTGDVTHQLVRLAITPSAEPAPAYAAPVRPALVEAVLNLHGQDSVVEKSP
jgi:type II secretory pathway pseudopilin PulG